MGLVHVFHEAIVPSKLAPGGGSIAIPALYDVQVIDRNCDASVAANYSDPLSITQAGWGDVVRDCGECPCRVADQAVDLITDVIAIVDKFANRECALTNARSDLEPKRPDFKINVTDMSRAVDAFRSFGYPFEPTDPGDPCP